MRMLQEEKFWEILGNPINRARRLAFAGKVRLPIATSSKSGKSWEILGNRLRRCDGSATVGVPVSPRHISKVWNFGEFWGIGSVAESCARGLRFEFPDDVS
jgi:hypothetical protein